MDTAKLAFQGTRCRKPNVRRGREEKNSQSSRRRMAYAVLATCDGSRENGQRVLRDR